MKVWLYASEKSKAGNRIWIKMKPHFMDDRLALFTTIPDLERGLREVHSIQNILVLVADNTDDLKELSYLHSLLSDHRILLVVPDQEDETIVMAHSLRPRFLAYSDSTMDDVAAVLFKMLGMEKTTQAVNAGRVLKAGHNLCG